MNKILVILYSLIFVIIGCGGSKPILNNNAEQVYSKAMQLFEDEDYREAASYFDIIKLQYPASQYADDAQFYLAEINFKRDEFIMAAYNYNMLRRVYPGSPFSKECLYKNALSFYKLSPTYDRDQEYTNKAIEAFMEFQYLYPEDSLAKEASIQIKELRDKLAYREFFTAELYRKMNSPRSSVIYYDAVINNFSDTQYYEDAFIGKIDALRYMKKYDQLQGVINAYNFQFPKGKALEQNKKILQEISN